MRVGRYRFVPPWWSVVVLLAFLVLFVSAGFWQIQRAQAKQVMLAQQQAAGKSRARPLIEALGSGGGAGAEQFYGENFVATGRFDGAHQILLDNQVFDDRVGYRVWTPLILPDGRRVLIDRGWVSIGPDGRADPPSPQAADGTVTVRGLLRDLPEPGIRLGNAPACEGAGWPRVLNYPTIETVRCLYNAPVVDGLMLLDEADPRGFARDWRANIGMPPIRHYGYAVQWFAMALAILVIFLVVNLKRIR